MIARLDSAADLAVRFAFGDLYVVGAPPTRHSNRRRDEHMRRYFLAAHGSAPRHYLACFSERAARPCGCRLSIPTRSFRIVTLVLTEELPANIAWCGRAFVPANRRLFLRRCFQSLFEFRFRRLAHIAPAPAPSRSCVLTLLPSRRLSLPKLDSGSPCSPRNVRLGLRLVGRHVRAQPRRCGPRSRAADFTPHLFEQRPVRRASRRHDTIGSRLHQTCSRSQAVRSSRYSLSQP